MTIKAQGWQAGLTGSAWSQPRDLRWRLMPVRGLHPRRHCDRRERRELCTMTVPSILYLTSETRNAPGWEPGSPLFRDLNLDQVIASVVKGKDAYDVRPFLYQPLPDIDGIVFRQGVFADLEDPETYAILARFAKAQLVATFAYRVKDLREDDLGFNHYHRERFFMNAVAQYCSTVTRARGRPRRKHGAIPRTARATRLPEQVRRLARVSSAHDRDRDPRGGARRRPLLRARKGRPDHRRLIRRRSGLQRERRPDLRAVPPGCGRELPPELSGHGLLRRSGRARPRGKGLPRALRAARRVLPSAPRLHGRCGSTPRPGAGVLSRLPRVHRQPASCGVVFSAPKLSSTDKREQVNDTFDLALAAQLTAREVPVVCNDLTLAAAERILVVSGPNNGGKTTLARTFGQLHYLARLGLPVPGRDAQFYLCDRIFTHFEKEEQITTLAGKLQDELNQLRADFDEATPASVFILNELFNTTSARDGLFLSVRILERVTALDALCVCVTFLDELASLNEKVVSMVATVVPDDPATRTYKVVRRPADGRALRACPC